MSFKNERKGDIFRQTLRELISSRPTLQEILREILQAQGIWYQTETWINTKSYRSLDMVKMKINIKDFFPLL